MEIHLRASRVTGGDLNVTAETNEDGPDRGRMKFVFEYAEPVHGYCDVVAVKSFWVDFSLEDIASLGALATSMIERQK